MACRHTLAYVAVRYGNHAHTLLLQSSHIIKFVTIYDLMHPFYTSIATTITLLLLITPVWSALRKGSRKTGRNKDGDSGSSQWNQPGATRTEQLGGLRCAFLGMYIPPFTRWICRTLMLLSSQWASCMSRRCHLFQAWRSGFRDFPIASVTRDNIADQKHLETRRYSSLAHLYAIS